MGGDGVNEHSPGVRTPSSSPPLPQVFLQWVWMAIYQGGVIMLLVVLLFSQSFLQIISITFTALILTELYMVFIEVCGAVPICSCCSCLYGCTGAQARLLLNNGDALSCAPPPPFRTVLLGLLKGAKM